MGDTKLKLILSGACGRMGLMLAKDFLTSGRVELVAAMDITNIGADIGFLAGLPEAGIKVSPTLDSILGNVAADVFLDFSTVEAALHYIPAALLAGLDCLIGVTGFTDGDMEKLKVYCEESGKVLWIVPNFSIGVNLMFAFAKRAAKMYPDCEIIELHHDGKRDAPSGTAFKTARDLKDIVAGKKKSQGAMEPSRGLNVEGVNIHSVRLPGLLAHQEVLFGGRGEVLTIRHDAMSRECFLPGIYLALDNIMSKHGFVFGIEDII